MRRLALVLLLAALAALNGCAYSAYGLYDDQRLMDTITDDKTLATSIKTALMNENFSGRLVHCRLFLLRATSSWWAKCPRTCRARPWPSPAATSRVP